MKVASNGLSIHVKEQGEGELTLVFLHYWGGSSRTWRHVTARLAAGSWPSTIAAGASPMPAEGYALADLAADAEA